MRVYNTLSRRKELLKPRRGTTLNLFVCGITPYEEPHIGNARTYVFFDALAKYLRGQGFDVFYLQNVTDLDDKIIRRAKETKKTPRALARFYERAYLRCMKALGVDSVTKYARATDYIPEIISQVERLMKKGYAYEIQGEGVYYDISRFKDYGKLSRRTVQQAEDATSRIDDSGKKRNKGDFALWKFVSAQQKKEGVPSWPFDSSLRSSLRTALPDGRPGWHIEDTAITEKFFGPQYDVHGGARDLIFPHHEAEIAQMEGISGKKPLARYWLHPGFLTVRGRKMAKSLGNFVTIRDFLEHYSPRVFRLLALKAHWRSPLDYSDDLLPQTERELERIDEFVDRLRETRNLKPGAQQPGFKKSFTFHVSRFKEALEDDFNTPKAIAALFELIREANSAMEEGRLSQSAARDILGFLREADRVFGFVFWGRAKQSRVPQEIRLLAEQRQNLRTKGEWARADALRKKMLQKGWQVVDTPAGFKVQRALQ